MGRLGLVAGLRWWLGFGGGGSVLACRLVAITGSSFWRSGLSTFPTGTYTYLRLIQRPGYLCTGALGNLLLHDNTTPRSRDMETTKTTTRIHPLMAAAAVSVIVV